MSGAGGGGMKFEFQIARKPQTGRDFDFLNRWMGGVSAVCSTISDYAEEFQPLHDNENCGVSVLLAGAVHSGFVGVCEHNIERIRDPDTLSIKGQRADLWLLDGGRGVSFEFKQYCSRKAHNRNLGGQMHHAKVAAQSLPVEQDRVFAGVLAPIFPEDPEHEFEEFSQYVDYSIRLRSGVDWTSFLYFDKVR